MKYFNYKFILLILFLIVIPYKCVNASEIILVCPDKGNPDSNLVCSLKGTSDKSISSLSAKISVKGDIEFIDFTTDSIWEGNGNNGKIDLYTDVNKNGFFEIGSITLKLGINGSVGGVYVNDVIYYDNSFKPIKVDNVFCDIRIASTNNNLSSLSLNGYDIIPSFSKEIFEYRSTVDSDEVLISATADDKNATLEGVGVKKLKYGDNIFSIIVTSEAGFRKEYKIIITRPEKNDFKEEDEKNKVPSKEEIKGDTKKSNDSKLKSLFIEGYNIDFNSNLYKYTIEISSDINEIKVDVIANDSSSVVVVSGDKQFNVGNNEVNITVIAEDGSKSEYIIYVIKKSNVCVIENIKILGYDFIFDCNSYEYELEIGFEESLNIDVVLNEELAKVSIYDNFNLKHNDIIKIIVEFDGKEYKYNIKILKNNFELGELFSNRQIIIMGIVLIITSLYIIGRKLYKKMKNKKNLSS